jgi:hypothetical protein
MGMFVRENQLVYFLGRISSSSFTDGYPYPLLLLFFAPLRLRAMQKSLYAFNQTSVESRSYRGGGSLLCFLTAVEAAVQTLATIKMPSPRVAGCKQPRCLRSLLPATHDVCASVVAPPAQSSGIFDAAPSIWHLPGGQGSLVNPALAFLMEK